MLSVASLLLSIKDRKTQACRFYWHTCRSTPENMYKIILSNNWSNDFEAHMTTLQNAHGTAAIWRNKIWKLKQNLHPALTFLTQSYRFLTTSHTKHPSRSTAKPKYTEYCIQSGMCQNLHRTTEKKDLKPEFGFLTRTRKNLTWARPEKVKPRPVPTTQTRK